MAYCNLTKTLLKFIIGLLTLFVHLQARWGKLKLIPLAYQASSKIQRLSWPTKARLIIVAGGDGEPYVTPNDYDNRFKAWVDVSNPKRARGPQDFRGEVFLNKVKFDAALRADLLIIYYVWNEANPSQNYVDSLFVSQLEHVSEFVTKPQVFDITFPVGFRFRFNLTTVCDKNWYDISCNVYCEAGQTFDCSITGSIKCHRGWQGAVCNTDVNECLEGTPCLNGGTCINLQGGFSCRCPSAYGGDTCEQDVDECLTGVCRNGGRCENTIGSFTCICTSGYTGDICTEDFNECLNKPCKNEGECENIFGSFRCRCTAFYNGNVCEYVNPCTTGNPCKNGGACNSVNGSFNCTCPAQYSGKLCDDINECVTQNPCKNGGTCLNTYGSFDCKCHKNFTGKECTEDVNECFEEYPCENGGICINLPGSFRCNCSSSHTGKLCTDKVAVTPPSILERIFSLMTGVVAAIVFSSLFLIGSCILIAIFVIQKKEWRRFRRNPFMRHFDFRSWYTRTMTTTTTMTMMTSTSKIEFDDKSEELTQD